MPDLALIQGAITGLKTAAEIAKSFLELKSIAEIQGKVIELQSAILAAQSSALAAQSDQSSMVQRIRELEEEIRRVKAWEETRQRYQLTSLWNGAFAYALKEQSKGSDPPHWICQNCYENGRKSILQYSRGHDGRHLEEHYVCAACKYKLLIATTTNPDPKYV